MKILYYTAKIFTIVSTKLLLRAKISGRENFPDKGGFILASNHISYYDPPIVGSWCPREVYFMAKKELFDIFLLGWVITACNSLPLKRGTFDRNAITVSVDVLKKGYGLTIFPEGTRSKTDDFLPGKPGVGMLAVSAQCPIIPVYIHGLNKMKDSFFGREKMSISYGKPISLEWINSQPPDKEGYRAIVQRVMSEIGELKAGRPS